MHRGYHPSGNNTNRLLTNPSEDISQKVEGSKSKSSYANQDPSGFEEGVFSHEDMRISSHMEEKERYGSTRMTGQSSTRRSTSILEVLFLVDDEITDTETTAGEAISKKSIWVKFWVLCRTLMFFGSCALPYFVLTIEEVKTAWFSSLMCIVAASLPSGGVPVAGGIVFYPILTTLSTLRTFEVVQFSAFTQVVGVGVLGPLNWIAKNPKVFLPRTILLSVVVGGIAIILTWQFLPELHEDVTEIIFTIFAAFVAVLILKGLVTGSLHSSSEEIVYNCKLYFFLIVASLFGGVLVWIIGIGIEKTIFTVLTSIGHGDSRDAAITSISIVGMVSAVSAYAKFLSRKAFVFWIMGLPGVLLGSSIGPWINGMLGKKRVMIIFLMLLVAEVAKSCYTLIVKDHIFGG